MQPTISSSTSQPSNAGPLEPLPQRYIGRLFERLESQMGTKVMDLYKGGNPESIQHEWSTGLAGFTPQELQRGLSRCQHRKFAPNLGEFAQLCRPTLDPEIAWHEAVAGLQAREAGEVGVWSHPAVWRAACTLRYELRTANLRDCRNRWDYELSNEFARGHVADVPPPAAAVLQIEAKRGPPPPEIRDKLRAAGFKLGQGEKS